MRTYTIIGGVNGAGKSSLAGVLSNERDELGIIVNVDEISARLCISNLEAGKIGIAQIRQLIAQGENFTQETTLSGNRTLLTIRSAKKKGYIVRLYYVGLETLEESLQRIQMRAANGGHFIAEDDVIRRFNRRYESLLRIMPYCDEVIFYDNGNGFVEIARYTEGTMLIKSKNPPKWLMDVNALLNRGRSLIRRF